MSASGEARKTVKLIMTDFVVLVTALIVTYFALMSLPDRTESYQMGVVSGIVAVVGLLFAFITCLSEDKIYSPGLAIFTGAHGLANGLNAVLNAAKELQKKSNKVKFIQSIIRSEKKCFGIFNSAL